MSTYQHDRDETIVLLSAEGMPLAVIRKLFRLSQTLHRLAVAQCNGDWPADAGDRWPVVFCPSCESGWHPSSMKRCAALEAKHGITDKDTGKAITFCPDCRAVEQVKALLRQTNNATYTGRDPVTEDLPLFKAVFQGDPRGCVLKVAVPSGRTNDGGREGICIPVRDRG